MKQRADVWLVTRGLTESREKAQALIMAGQVYVGEKKIMKSSELLPEDAKVIRLSYGGAEEERFAEAEEERIVEAEEN